MAGKQFSIYGEIKVNTASVKRDMSELSRELNKVKREIDDTERQAEELGVANNQTARTFERLRNDADRARAIIRQANKEFKAGEISATQYTQRVRQAAAGHASLSGRLRDTDARLKDASASMGKFTLKSVAAGVALGGFAIAAYKITSLLGDGVRHMFRYTLELDQMRNKLLAVTGDSATLATVWAKLNTVAGQSVGVTRAFARETYALLKASGLNEAAIYKLIPALGKLNAAFSIPDLPRFTQNLQQFFNEGFDLTNFREARNQVAIFPEILRKAFGTDNLAELRKLQEQGKLTADQYIEGIIKGVNESSVGKSVGESMSVQMAKAGEKLSEAFEPAAKALFTPIITRITTLGQEMATEIEGQEGDFFAIGSTIANFMGRGLGEGLRSVFADAFKVMRESSKREQSAFEKQWAQDGLGVLLVDEFFRSMRKAFATVLPYNAEVLGGMIEGLFGVKLETPSVRGIKRTLNSILNAVSEFVPTLYNAFYAMGLNTVAGLLEGLYQRFNEVKAWAGKLATTMINVASGGLGISSPSKVFRQIGAYVVEGFIEGIVITLPAAKRAMDEFVSVAVGAGERVKISIGDMMRDVQSLLRSTGITAEESPLERLIKLLSSPDVAARLGDQANVLLRMAETMKLFADEAAQAAKQLTLITGLSSSQDNVGDPPGGLQTPGGSGNPLPAGNPGYNGQPSTAGGIFEALQPPPTLKPAWEDFFSTLFGKFTELKATLPSLKQAIGENLIDGILRVGDVFANALTQWATGAQSFMKSMAQGFKQLISQIISELIRLMVMKFLLNLLGNVAGGAGGGHASGGLGSASGAGAAGGSIGGAPGLASFGGGASLLMAGAGGGSITNNSTFSPTINLTASGNRQEDNRTIAQVKREMLLLLKQSQREGR